MDDSVPPDLRETESTDSDAITEKASGPGCFPPGIPLPPMLSLPAEFECLIYFRVKKIRKPSDWTKHVYEDLQPFNCTFPLCPEPKSFKRKIDWHLVREHRLPEPKAKTGAAEGRSHENSGTAWVMIRQCHHETTVNPQDEPCKFCGKVSNSWKRLTAHLAKHMEQISTPILELVAKQHITADTIVSPIEARPIPLLPQPIFDQDLLFDQKSYLNYHLPFGVSTDLGANISLEIQSPYTSSRLPSAWETLPLGRALSRESYFTANPPNSVSDNNWNAQPWDIRSIASFGDSGIGFSMAGPAPKVNWEINSVVASIDSQFKSRPASIDSASIIERHTPNSAQQELLLILHSDLVLRALFAEGAKRINKGRFIRNVKRLMLLFYRDLRNTAADSREMDATSMLGRHAEWFASQLFDLSNPKNTMNSDKMKTYLDQHIDKRPMLEKYLGSAVTQLDLNRILEGMEAKGDEDGDEEILSSESDSYETGSISTFDETSQHGGDIDYAEFPNIEHIKKFVIGGAPFTNLRRHTFQFVHPEAPSQTFQPHGIAPLGPVGTTLANKQSTAHFSMHKVANTVVRISFADLAWNWVLARRFIRRHKTLARANSGTLKQTIVDLKIPVEMSSALRTDSPNLDALAGRFSLENCQTHSPFGEVSVTLVQEVGSEPLRTLVSSESDSGETRLESELSALQSSGHTSISTEMHDPAINGAEDYNSDEDSGILSDDPELCDGRNELRTLDPKTYFQGLAALEREVYEHSSIMAHKIDESSGPDQDAAWRLYPEESAKRMDQELIIEMVKQTRSEELLRLLECHNLVVRTSQNLKKLQDYGYYAQAFSLLVIDSTRRGVAKLVQIEIERAFDLSAAFELMLNSVVSKAQQLGAMDIDKDTISSIIQSEDRPEGVTTKCFSTLVAIKLMPLSLRSNKSCELWVSAVQVLELAVICYAGAFIQRFDLRFLDTNFDLFQIPRKAVYYDPELRSI
ncbi:MAG: hypothetical protein M1818_007197 [Claussenomyces sp. TS43310]|nr:MAG: hypothetical protein M1818_007197 [Claussenomyces sp. TS43310]